MGTLGLKGAQIGSNINGSNLDDARLDPFWAVANELDAFIMVHPTAVAGAERLKAYYLVNLIGNPLDTTIATAALVFGDVIGRYPRIKLECARQVEALSIAEPDREQILGGAAMKLLALA